MRATAAAFWVAIMGGFIGAVAIYPVSLIFSILTHPIEKFF